MFYACREGQLETVKFMAEKGCNINHIDNYEENCLFYAASTGRLEICKFLVEQGINFN